MKIVKVINNNLVKSHDKNQNEVLVMGCGLGFKKNIGDIIDESLIENIYTSENKSNSNKLIELLNSVPIEYVQVSNEIISYAKSSLTSKIKDSIYLTLTDHINSAVDRHKDGIAIRNALLWEIKRFYNHEFLVGKNALDIIKRKLGIELNEDEAGFITLHLVNASIGNGEMYKTTNMTKMIQNILDIVKYHFNVELDEYSLHYERFLTHLKFFAQRVIKEIRLNDNDKNFLFTIKNQYPNEYKCSLKIRSYVMKEFNRELTEDELIYLTIHISRVITK